MAKTTGRRRIKWEYGDIFGVPLSDGSYGLCQAAYDVFPHVVDCAFFRHRMHELPAEVPALNSTDVVSLTAVWKNPLKNGSWPRIGNAPPVLPSSAFPNQILLRESKGVGVKHSNEPMVESFLSAWHGLLPWNTYFEEDYLDKMLAPGVTRPRDAIVLDPKARIEWRDREQRELEAKRSALAATTKRARR